MIAAANYKKKKRRAMIGIVVSAIILVLTLSMGLAGLFFYLDAVEKASRAQQREEWFDPWEDSGSGRQDAFKTWEIIGLTEEFASDFKETYHYYFAFDKEWYPFIVKMKGELDEGFGPYMDYVYEEDAAEPEPLMLRGVAAPIEDDIRGFAIECMNILYEEEFMTEENFEDYMGISLLDMSGVPLGQADFGVSRPFFIVGFIGSVMAVLLIVLYVRNWRNASHAEGRERENMRRASVWQNRPEESEMSGASEVSGVSGMSGSGQVPGSSDGVYEGADGAYGSAGGGYMGESMGRPGGSGGAGAGSGYGYTGSASTGYTNGSGVRLVPVRKSNVFLGIIGAIGGSLVGVVLWIMISMVGFVAGIAGYVMLKFALKGYERLSGCLDRKGAAISLIVAAFMVTFACVLDYVIILCRAFFEWDASFDTVRYVVMNFGTLMTELDTWRGFAVNLLVGYALSVWSSYQLIGETLRVK